ncbi:hypothetical protein ACFXJ8_42510 [Nonomuraea sp. NPDC059194]|uniref:hypothetical protein n=1 Tax=Nonomuraea sp. NPDC059194 TaxID=3346764 RepID=UPI0036B7A93C
MTETSKISQSPTLLFARHYGEMVLAMIVGMVLLGPVWTAAGQWLGLTAVFSRTDVGAMIMATNMTAAMTVWMRHRGHAWAPVVEMGAAMYVPFLLLLPPFWLGAVSGGTVMLAGHVLMLPAMLAAMLWRREEYSRGHHEHAHDRKPSHPLAAVLKKRWPTWIALLMTFDTWIHPFVPPAWILLFLPGAYLAIGAYRRTLGNPRVLALQIAGLLAYLALAAIAMSVDETTARYLVAGGWLVHSLWDLAHHRADAVVPRGYAEWCAVVDLVVGLTVIVLL